MNIEDVKQKIAELTAEFHELNIASNDEMQFAELIEEEVTNLIVYYCEEHKYMINGFPYEKRELFKTQTTIDNEEEDEFFSQERFQLYLDCLAIEKDDVADLLWFYNNNFWPSSFESKEIFIELIKEQIELDKKFL